MANYMPEERRTELRSKVLHAAAKLFLEKGYSNAATREIARLAGVNVSTMNREFGTKENILCELVTYVLEGQFGRVEKLLEGVTDDKVLFYAAETTLQLYMAESDERIRELYATAYSLPKTTDVIQKTITQKLEDLFGDCLPGLETKDFYELEMVSGSIMRGFMARPCDMYFTIERKVSRFLESVFRVYGFPQEKIRESIEFISRFDCETLARETVASMLQYLEEGMA